MNKMPNKFNFMINNPNAIPMPQLENKPSKKLKMPLLLHNLHLLQVKLLNKPMFKKCKY